ncbi:hypothetical protein Q1W71_01440 [Flavobacterium pectinovorum]|uniref:hypothetical protein n=1 Tax=Flavobacterium pectinovorum TaxID=29533 RepID=UPI00265D7C75|nr:hypothetical protein [Flavobacterium pectinovorum]WKL48447.1 hypothetical protein Q1W71_01440 [Flavobacterium pectinovorum]
MIKTKTAFIIFTTLTLIIFPYYILILSIDSDFFNSIIPGWHTTIIPIRIISNLFKFLVLIITSFYYWRLSKVVNELDFKKFTIHFLLTIPAVLIAKMNLYDFVTTDLYSPESFQSVIQTVVFINILFNIMFFAGQIFFGIFCARINRSCQ